MPYYSYHCPVCRLKQDVYRKIDDRDDLLVHCGSPSQRRIQAPALKVDIPAYVSPASGKLISSRAERREDLLREGCIENEPGLREHIAAQRTYNIDKAFEPISAAIDQTVSSLHASGHITD